MLIFFFLISGSLKHSKDLVPVGVLETLPVDSLRKMGGLQSEVCSYLYRCTYEKLKLYEKKLKLFW